VLIDHTRNPREFLVALQSASFAGCDFEDPRDSYPHPRIDFLCSSKIEQRNGNLRRSLTARKTLRPRMANLEAGWYWTPNQSLRPQCASRIPVALATTRQLRYGHAVSISADGARRRVSEQGFVDREIREGCKCKFRVRVLLFFEARTVGRDVHRCRPSSRIGWAAGTRNEMIDSASESGRRSN
jgi:hypothetical protein